MAALARVYMDESGTHDKSPVMTMAAYLFWDVQAHRFTVEWQKVLDRYGLPYAHMANCTCGSGPYAHLDKAARVATEKELIAAIKRRTVFGFAVSVVPDRYAKLVSVEPKAPTAYTFCLMSCVTRIRKWIEETGYDGDVAYIFEAGHQHRPEADFYMQDIAEGGPEVMRKYGYVSHSFIDKRKALPLQAADMLAWQYQHYLKRKIVDGHDAMRRDFIALVRNKDHRQDWSDATLEEFRKAFEEDRIRLPGEPRA